MTLWSTSALPQEHWKLQEASVLPLFSKLNSALGRTGKGRTYIQFDSVTPQASALANVARCFIQTSPNLHLSPFRVSGLPFEVQGDGEAPR